MSFHRDILVLQSLVLVIFLSHNVYLSQAESEWLSDDDDFGFNQHGIHKGIGKIGKNHVLNDHKDAYHKKDDWLRYRDHKLKHASNGWKERDKQARRHLDSSKKRKHEHDFDGHKKFSGEKGKYVKGQYEKEKKKGLKKKWNEGGSELKTFNWNRGKHFEKGHNEKLAKHRHHHGHDSKEVKGAQQSYADNDHSHVEKDHFRKLGLKDHANRDEKVQDEKKKAEEFKQLESKAYKGKKADYSYLEKPEFYGKGHGYRISKPKKTPANHDFPVYDHESDDNQALKEGNLDDSHEFHGEDDLTSDGLDFKMPKDMDSAKGLKDYFGIDDFGF